MNKNYHLMAPGDPFPSLSLEISIDLETNGLSLADPAIQVCGIGIGDSDGQYYFPLRHQSSPESPILSTMNHQGFHQERLGQWIKNVLNISSRCVIFHNAAFDLGFLRKEFQWPDWSVLSATIEDSMILATLLDENRSVSLEQLTRSLLRIPPEQKEKFQGFFQFYTLSPEVVSDYCCEDVWLTLNVWKKLTQHPDCEAIQTVYRHELRFSLTLAQMELQGCSYSSTELKRIRARFSLGWDTLLEKVYVLLPETITKSEFLRAPSGMADECIRLFQQFPISEQPETLPSLQKLKPVLESYDRLGKMLALFPFSDCGVVSPRYYVVKTDGRLVSPLHELEKNALAQEWDLKKLITVNSDEWLCEVRFEAIFPNPVLSLVVSSLLGRRRHLPLEKLDQASQAFFSMASSEFMKTVMNFFPQRVLFHFENQILLKIATLEEANRLIQTLPNPLKIGDYLVPFKVWKSFGKNWQEMSSESSPEDL